MNRTGRFRSRRETLKGGLCYDDDDKTVEWDEIDISKMWERVKQVVFGST